MGDEIEEKEFEVYVTATFRVMAFTESEAISTAHDHLKGGGVLQSFNIEVEEA